MTTRGPIFHSGPEYYDANLSHARNTKAGPATLTNERGERQPGVILYNGGKIYGILPIPEALRIANQIADVVNAQRGIKE